MFMASNFLYSPTLDIPISSSRLGQANSLLFHPLRQSPESLRNFCSKTILNCSRYNPVKPSSLIVRAVKGGLIQSANSESTSDSNSPSAASSKLVFVVGGSGGVGQNLKSLVPSPLWTTSGSIPIEPKVKIRLLLRNPEKATALFGEHDDEMMQKFGRFSEEIPEILKILIHPCSRVLLM